MNMRNVVSIVALGTLAGAAVTGCSSDDHPVRNTAAVSSNATNPVPTKIANEPKVRKNVALTKCAEIPGGWSAEGTATNPGKKPVTYKITVHFTTRQATTLDYAEALVPVAPGKTVPWAAEKEFHAEKKMLCPTPGISEVSS
ncbi:hypothetical protein [Actinomadura sp. DC4]|uniref:hypothetical protein n=1 Tax=Actinomadura sp. DC4 TaxID=3055069 RepID=UPI0025B019B9|nr:hypothetical protein [Actinomadura sp. DC4]MDN3359070.1 hypothetical protein [Actinomadura sp. DC4]